MSDTIKSILSILVIAIVVLALLTLASQPRTKNEAQTPELETRCFLFPEGYELVSRDSYAFQYSGPNTVYICRHLETGQYRQCIPQYVTCEGE